MSPVKYTRTYHFDFSNGVQSDDKIISDLSHFEGMEIVITEKLDGENTSLYSAEDGGMLHARSIDSQTNWTRSWVTRMQSVLKFDIPKNIKLTGENVFAKHSIEYNDLESFFFLFAVWENTEQGIISLSYDDIIEYAQLLDLATPQLFYRGVFDLDKIKEIANNLDTEKVEGFVVRNANSFNIKDTNKNIAKYVREGHVQPDAEHWLKNTTENKLSTSKRIKPFYMA